MKLIKKKFGKDVSKDVKAVSKLRREAERAKRALSSQHQVCAQKCVAIGKKILNRELHCMHSCPSQMFVGQRCGPF